MSEPSLVPVVLSGGSGTRLWPVSRDKHPKQLQPLLEGATAALEKLRWTPNTTFAELVAETANEGLRSIERDELITQHGYKTMDRHE